MPIKQPCITCGHPTTNTTRCDNCTKTNYRINAKTQNKQPKQTPQERGYDHKWKQLSKRARKLQPFCTDCGTTTDLQCDHSPTAWERHAKKLSIRIKDIDVVCGHCNRLRGRQRPQKPKTI